MCQKILNVDCTSFRDGRCLHQAAPRRMFFAAECILVYPYGDVRVPQECALISPRPRPARPIPPPPMRARRVETCPPGDE